MMKFYKYQALGNDYQLHIDIDENFDIVMTGPVTKVAEGRIDQEMFNVPGRIDGILQTANETG
jgi:diaminopimelate epimerase